MSSERKKKILIVDDEESLIELTTMILEKEGFICLSAVNGIDALRIAQQETPDLIILDFLMPDMDGFSFYKKMKEKENLADIPVIVLTARASTQDSFLALGTAGFLAKPFESEDLLKRIEKIFEREPEQVEAKSNTLISGNDESVLKKMVKYLTGRSLRIDYCVGGKEVLLKSLELEPEVILLDIRMMDISAHEIIRSLRSLAQFRGKIISTFCFLTQGEENCGIDESKNTAIEEEKLACREAGVNDDLGMIIESSQYLEIEKYLKEKILSGDSL